MSPFESISLANGAQPLPRHPAAPPPRTGQGQARAWATRALVPVLALVLSACGGGGDSGQADVPPAGDGGSGGRAEALSASRPGELASWARERLRAQATAGTLPAVATIGLVGGDVLTTTTTGVAPPAAAAPGASPATTGSTATTGDRSGTLVQEAGVDEADLLLSDGARLYTLQPETSARLKVAVHTRGADGVASRTAEVLLSEPGAMDLSSTGMVLAQEQRALAVVSQAWLPVAEADLCPLSGGCAPLPPVSRPSGGGVASDPATGASTAALPAIMPFYLRESVGVHRVDIANPSQPSATQRLSIDGSLVDSRRIGSRLYLVTRYAPRLPAYVLPATATSAQRDAAIAATSAEQILPRLRRNGGQPEPLLADTDCWVQTRNAAAEIAVTTVTVIDLASPSLAQTSRCFVGGSEAIYMTPTSLYLATTRYTLPRWEGAMPALAVIFPQDVKTDIHKFALDGASVAYRGSGVVDGHLGWDPQRKSFRLSEHQGDLRVLTFTGETGWFTIADATVPGRAPSPARLTVLRERASDRTLQVLATLPNANRPAHIGKPGEQVYGVRFVGDRGYVVTFRRTDPLYVLDLSNPADPRMVGELEIAGFSEHLFPLPGGLLLGVGRSADSQGRIDGLKVALFDVRDPARPTEAASHVFGGSGSQMALDLSRHGLNTLMRGSVARVAMPVNLLPDNWWMSNTGTPGSAGLQRFEVDTAARTLRALPMLGQSRAEAYRQTWLERSLQIDDQVYYLSGGNVGTFRW